MSNTREIRGSAQADVGSRAVKIRWFVLGITCLVLVLNYADRAALGVAGSTIIDEFHLTKTEFGLISSIFFFGYAPFCFIGGWLSDKYGPRKVMCAAVAWWSIFTGLTAAGAGYLSFLVIRFLFGFGEGPQGSVTIKTMRNWFPQRQMGTAVGISQGCTPLGGVIGTPLVAWLVASSGDWRIPFIVLGVVGVLVAIGWWVVVRDNPDVHPWATREEADDLRNEDLASNGAVDTTGRSLGSYLVDPFVLATALAFFAYAWVLYTFLAWFPVYLVDAEHVQLKSVAWVGMIPWVLGVVGYMAGGIMTDWIASKTGKPAESRKWVVILGLIGTAVLLGCIGLVHSLWPAVALMSGVVFLLYLTGAQYFLLISDTMPNSKLGGIVGFVHFIANTAGIFAPLLVGYIVDKTGSWALTFGVSAAVCVAGVVVMIIWGRVSTVRQTA